MKTVTPVQYNELRCAFDPEKLAAYESFLKDTVEGKVVCDLGSGCGILSYLALYYGATKVYCLDSNKAALDRASELLGTDSAEFIECDLLNVTFPEADIYIHEIYGSVLYEERITSIFDNLRSQGLEHKCFPNKGEFFAYECDSLSSEKYIYNVDDFTPGTREYHSLLTEEEIEIGCKVTSYRCYNYTEKKVIKEFDLTVDKGSRFIYNMLEMVPSLGWRSTFPNGASFSNSPRKGNNWFLLEDRKHMYNKRLQLTHKAQEIINPYEVNPCQFSL